MQRKAEYRSEKLEKAAISKMSAWRTEKAAKSRISKKGQRSGEKKDIEV